MPEALQTIAHGTLHREHNKKSVITLDDLPGVDDRLMGDFEVLVFIQAKDQSIGGGEVPALSNDEWARVCSSNDAFDFLRDDESCEGLFSEDQLVSTS